MLSVCFVLAREAVGASHKPEHQLGSDINAC